jgi:hypothetical protein
LVLRLGNLLNVSWAVSGCDVLRAIPVVGFHMKQH